MDAFKEIVLRAAREGVPVKVAGGTYVVYSAGGAELWTQLDPRNSIIGCNPHFAGSGRMLAEITEFMPAASGPLDGAVHCWVVGADREQVYPCIVDVPNFRSLESRLDVPAQVELQVSAFAHRLTCYADDQAFAKAQESEWKGSRAKGYAAESFIPSGMFRTDPSDTNPPRAEAIFAGHIEQAAKLENPVTGEEYHHLVVKTLEATIDVVAEPVVLRGTPIEGGVAHGHFWLSGRLPKTDVPTEQGR